MSRIIKSEESVLEDFRVNLYEQKRMEEIHEDEDTSKEEEYRKKYELISKEKKQILEHARLQANQTASRVLEEAYAQRDKIVNTAETEAERLKKAAEEEGFAEGMTNSRIYLNDTLAGLNEELEKLKKEQEEAFEKLNRDILLIAMNMAEKILKKQLEEDPLAMESLVESVLKEEKGKKQITIHLSGRAYKLAEELEKKLDSIREQSKSQIKIKKEDIPYSDLRVETEDGILDASIPVQLRNLKEFLSEYMEKE